MGMSIDDEREMRANGITNVEIKHIKQLYENRLKADIVAMLEELKDEIFKESWRLECLCDDLDGSAVDLDDINKIIQQKINKLREGEL